MRRRLLALLTVLALFASAASVAVAAPAATDPPDDWPATRGGAGHAGSNDGAAPTGPNATVAWRRRSDHDDGPGQPTGPAVVNGTAYVGYLDVGDDRTFDSRGHVVAYDATTGGVVWNRSDLPGVESVPTVAGGRVFVTSHGDADECPDVCAPDPADEQAGVYALNATTGETLWARTDTDPALTPWETATRSVVSNGRVYVATRADGVYALDAETGATVWNRSGGVDDVAVGDGAVVVRYDAGANETGLRALDPATGETRWTTHLTETPAHADLPTYANRAPDLVAVADGTAYLSVQRDRLVAVALADGSVQWTASPTGDHPNGTTDWTSAPAVGDGTVYVSTLDADHTGTDRSLGTVHAVDADTGETVWRFDTAARVDDPTVANDTVYAGAVYPSVASARDTGTADVGVYALNATSGGERWNYVVSQSLTEQRDRGVSTAPAAGSLFATVVDLHAYQQAGSVTALRSTTDAQGPAERFANDSVAAAENAPPSVSVAVDPPNATADPVPAGTTVTLTANASDADGTVRLVQWDVDGDGVYDRRGDRVTVEAEACRTYDVTVRAVDDDDATATATTGVSVACEGGC
ncbi:MAG: PQQ-binding-like beta-propeller repeat protein [Halobacteriaceae archaeon]